MNQKSLDKKKTEPKSTVSFCSKCGGITYNSEVPKSKRYRFCECLDFNLLSTTTIL